jgi:capsular exopolysaccharide synthesis family protein
MVVATGEEDLSSALAGDNLAQSKAVSYESLAMTRPVAQRTVDILGIDAAPEDLLNDVSAGVPANTREVQITANAETPEGAADLANAWVLALAEQVPLVENEGGNSEVSGTGRVTVQPLNNAFPPEGPSSPNLKMNLPLGLLVGIGLGLVYALVRYRMDRRIRSLDDIRNAFGVPVLGVIPKDNRLTHHRAIIETGFSRGHGGHEFSEALRELRTNLRYISVDNPPRTIVVTSSLPGEGKSSITANLAVAIASTGRNVVVVDGDLRRPAVVDLFGLTSGVGVTNVLVGDILVDDALQTYDKFPNLKVLGAGELAPNPTELLSSEAMHTMLETLAKDALVLVDAPPLLQFTDAVLLTASTDGAIIVATAQQTTKDHLLEAIANLRQVQGHVFGVVLNRAPTTGADAMYYGKNYYSPAIEQTEDVEPAPEARVRKPHGVPAPYIPHDDKGWT